MFERITNSWTLFSGLLCGVILLMISVRPDLQPRPGHEQTPAHEIELAGKILSLSCGTVLTYRMVRGARQAAQGQVDRSQRGA
ncbi:hypothetical protein DB30_01149 [Enhygromyxa salina]|uniref:Uncharacterized protein n=1 Tax=Enhygromyxa salina TaxID=215803 RepID=A0A0C2CN53_9BACT|nr:hypothetical protein [Enhygromyxa salina]KIG12661.1 hypothetical protein DB30_01149 [Enhygromyxa salina]